MERIVLTNPRILAYFGAHADVDPESAVLFFVEMLDRFGGDIADKLAGSLQAQILAGVSEMKQRHQAMSESLARLGADVTNSVFVRMVEIKKEYLDETRAALALNASEKIGALLTASNQQMLDKTQLLLNEALPRSAHALQVRVEEQLRAFQQATAEEVSRATSGARDAQPQFAALDKKFDALMADIHKPMFAIVNSAEGRLQATTKSLHDLAAAAGQAQEKMQGDLAEVLCKYRGSSLKGQQGENQLFALLTQMFPSGDITCTTAQKSAGDFMLRRQDRAPIVFETKEYAANVPLEEIRKFIRDTETVGASGVFLSQTSGIACRANFQIEFNRGHVLVFVHHVGYAREKIQIAVDIVDHMLAKVKEHALEGGDAAVSKDALDDINREFQAFVAQKEALLASVKDSHRRTVAQIEDMRFPSLDRFLGSKFACTASVAARASTRHTCDICGAFSASNLKALAAHKRAHKFSVSAPAADDAQN